MHSFISRYEFRGFFFNFNDKPKSAETIAREMKEETGVQLCARTIRNLFNQGDAGKAPRKRGPPCGQKE